MPNRVPGASWNREPARPANDDLIGQGVGRIAGIDVAGRQPQCPRPCPGEAPGSFQIVNRGGHSRPHPVRARGAPLQGGRESANTDRVQLHPVDPRLLRVPRGHRAPVRTDCRGPGAGARHRSRLLQSVPAEEREEWLRARDLADVGSEAYLYLFGVLLGGVGLGMALFEAAYVCARYSRHCPLEYHVTNPAWTQASTVTRELAAARRGKKRSAGTRAKMSEAHRERGTRPPKAGSPWTAEGGAAARAAVRGSGKGHRADTQGRLFVAPRPGDAGRAQVEGRDTIHPAALTT
jgi:hypothetical protein